MNLKLIMLRWEKKKQCLFGSSFCWFRHELHVIVDEVYMLTVFDESVTFHSVLSLDRYGLSTPLNP